jgi:hypothetical protein
MMKRMTKISSISILVYMLFAGPAAADLSVDFDAVIGTGPQYYGSNLFWTEEDVDLIKDRIDQSNMNIMRVYIQPFLIENPNDNDDPNSINWDGFDFDPGFTWSGKTLGYSSMFETLKELDIYIMISIPYLSPWLSANNHSADDIYSTYPPNNYDEYKEFVYAVMFHMVNYVGISPDKIILEPFNEPDLGCGQDPSVPCCWRNHTMDDTVVTFLAAYNAAKSVSPYIRVVGMAEWDDGRYVRNFINNHNGLNYLEGITYHKYLNNYDIQALISEGTEAMKNYGLPVFANEYGSLTWGSDGTNGALWHSFTLTYLLKNGIHPLQFPFSEFPGINDPYGRMGLFYDWRNNWQIKNSFWIYSNILGFMKDTEIINTNLSGQNLDVIAGKRNGEINIVITNRDSIDKGVTIAVDNFPGNYLNITVYDNFQMNYVIDSFGISGNSFEYVIPSRRSVTVCVAANGQNPAPATITLLTYDDFESGWGSYTDGGGDCSLYTGATYAHQGTNAANIRDNSGQASSFYHTGSIDVHTAGYTQIEIDFWFYPRSMESGEDFWVQYYDGSSWHTVASYAGGTDFSNGQFYNETVYVNEGTYAFPTNMKIRFQCDASGDYDFVYIDEIKVSGITPGEIDNDEDGYNVPEDCDDNNPEINPDATEVCDGKDNNCDGSIDEGFDNDQDGYTTCGGDCDDSDPNTNPEAAEVCDDGADNDCDGDIDEELDEDGDGFTGCDGDCDDSDPDISPGASEKCDGKDNDCDGITDEENAEGCVTYYEDVDYDTYGVAGDTKCLCAPEEFYTTTMVGDCDDNNSAINPGVVEVCDEVDNNCDGQVDEGVKNTYYRDVDGDGYGNPYNITDACSAPPGYVSDNTDCYDTEPNINPGVAEVCDEVDNNCDGQVDEGVKNTYFRDADGDGYGDMNKITDACLAPTGYISDNTDCNDNDPNINPGATEVCDDGVDNDCDRDTDSEDPDCVSEPKRFCGAAAMYRDGVVDSRLSAADSFGKAFLPLLLALPALLLWTLVKRKKKA